MLFIKRTPFPAGDELVIADANFPSESIADAGPCPGGVVRMDGLDVPTVLKSVLHLMPLDQFVDEPAAVMQRVDEPSEAAPVWSKFQEACDASEGKAVSIERVERFAFYERAKNAFGVIHTGETALYGNIIIKKGVLTADQQTVV